MWQLLPPKKRLELIAKHEAEVRGEVLEAAETARHASITHKRIMKGIGPTLGCPGCSTPGKEHTTKCRDRFDSAYKKEDSTPDGKGASTLTSTAAEPDGPSDDDVGGTSSSSTSAPGAALSTTSTAASAEELEGSPADSIQYISPPPPPLNGEGRRRDKQGLNLGAAYKGASGNPNGSKIHIVEVCCGPNSVLGEVSPGFEGSPADFNSSRITIEDDFRTEKGLKTALGEIEKASKSEVSVVWLALPCTGGCPWNNINVMKPGGDVKIQQHINDFYALASNARILMHRARQLNVMLAWEWPKCCQLWGNPVAEQIMSELGLTKYSFDGCALGLTATAKKYKDMPIRKGWTIATDCKALGETLAECKCDCNTKHAPCAGVDTKKSEKYTPMLATFVQNTLYNIAAKKEDVCAAAESVDLNSEAPLMPTTHIKQGHREKLVKHLPELNAAVARLLTKTEVKADKKAMQAILEEKHKLLDRATWDESTVMEYDDLVKQMKAYGKSVDIGRIHSICSEKGSELPYGHPDRKMKGRIVFQGNNVKDSNGNYAIFAELSSCPVAMEASKICDFYGSIDGNTVEQADARQAYVQAKLGGNETWIEVPPELRPESWAGFRRPVCRLMMALYGHPDAGGYWEKHSFRIIKRAGFVPIDEWNSVFWNPKTKVLLVVYVDDLKVAGPVKAVSQTWKDLKDIDLDPPTAVGRYLGCNHTREVTKNGTKMTYDMRDFMVACCERYTELVGGDVKFKPASTPFLQEDSLKDDDFMAPGQLLSLIHI